MLKTCNNNHNIRSKQHKNTSYLLVSLFSDSLLQGSVQK